MTCEYPEARRLLTAHDAKGPTARRAGAWYDFVIEVRKQLGDPRENLFESFPEDADMIVRIIEKDPALTGLANPCNAVSQSDQEQIQTHIKDLNDSEAMIIQALAEHGNRLSGEDLLKKAHGKSGSHGKGILASLVKRSKLTNRRDCKPPGYGLPWWP